MERQKGFPWITCIAIFLCVCITVTSLGLGGVWLKRNGTTVWQYIDLPTRISGGNPVVATAVSYEMTQQAVPADTQPAETPRPGEPTPTVTPSPTPTLQQIDQLRVINPDPENFQEFLQHFNSVGGKSVLLLDSGLSMKGTATFRDTRTVGESVKFPISLIFGNSRIQIVDETFTSTVATYIDEAIYTPAILSQATVLPNLLDPKVHVLITNDAGEEEIVEMYTGTVVVPYASTCWTGFGMDVWQNRQEPGRVSRFEKILDAAYWSIQAEFTGDQYATWALPRFRWASVLASYNAILPVGSDGHRVWTQLDKIHNGDQTLGNMGSVYYLTQPSGNFNDPNAYDLLLGHFNAKDPDYAEKYAQAHNGMQPTQILTFAQQHGFAEITAIKFTVPPVRGNVLCGTNSPLMDQATEDLLNGPVPANFLLDEKNFQPELQR